MAEAQESGASAAEGAGQSNGAAAEESKSPAELKKDEGNAFFTRGDLGKAVRAYTEGIRLDANAHLLYSNRAAAYLKLGNLKEAVKDARQCVRIAPDWAKGYTRLAQALLQLGMLDECEKTIAKIKEMDPEQRSLQKLIEQVNQKRMFNKLEGPWYGKVSDEQGGYMQEFDFKTDTEMDVTVFGRTIPARLKLNASADPPHLDLLVRSEEHQPQAPEVKHIFKIDDNDVLHLCSPYMTPPEERPTKFEGPAYVRMQRGRPPADRENDEMKRTVAGLSMAEKCKRFANEVAAILPDKRIAPRQTDTELQSAELMKENIKFQTAYYKIKELYGEDVEELLRSCLETSVQCPSVEAEIAVNEMRRKMQVCELYPSDNEMKELLRQQGVTPAPSLLTTQDNSPAPQNSGAPAQASTAPPAAAAPTLTTAKKSTVAPTPGGPAGSAVGSAAAPPAAAADASPAKDNSNLILAVGLVALGLAAVAAFALSKKKS